METPGPQRRRIRFRMKKPESMIRPRAVIAREGDTPSRRARRSAAPPRSPSSSTASGTSAHPAKARGKSSTVTASKQNVMRLASIA